MARKKTTAKARQTTARPKASGGTRVYTFEVFLLTGPVTRRFAKRNPVVSRVLLLRGDQTLADLHQAIFDAHGREEQHMYEFQLGGKGPMDPEAARYVLPGAFELDREQGRPAAGRVDLTTLDSLGLEAGDRFGYWFDFGDDWWHQVNVEGVEGKVPRGKFPRVTKRVGRSPPQYVDWEQEEE